MSERDPVGNYSADEIHGLLRRIQAEHPSAQNPAPTPAASSGANSSGETSGSSNRQPSGSELGVTQELSVEEILNKIRRDIAEEEVRPAAGNQSSWTTTVHRRQGA